jgi:uncharacterized repeat protein (TIGR01451 family)
MRNVLRVFIIGLMCALMVQPAWAIASPALTIAATPFPLVVNQLARVTIVGHNPSPEAADNVVITSGVPNNLGIQNVSASQGGISVYNSAITVHVGRLEPNQSVTVDVDVVVVDAYPSDAPFNMCAGLTFTNGVARLSCLPNQRAASPGTRPIGTLPPNGQRPIYDPNRPPVFLPVSGASPASLGLLLAAGGLMLVALSRRVHRRR